MSTVADKVPFHQFAVLLEKIYDLSGTENKKKLLKEFIDEWRSFETRLHASDSAAVQNDTFFPAMRLLLPQLDKDRDAYGIKEHTLAKLYIELLGLGKDSPAAQKLLNYRAPKNAKGDSGDFASVAYWILKPRCPEKGTLSVADINACLDGVAMGNAAKDKDAVRRHLLNALRNTTAKEQKWLIRIIMKELKIGLSQQSVLSVFHLDAEDLYNVKMSLDKVCSMLKDPSVRLHEIEISIFSPFRPMLGDRAAPNKIEHLMKGKSFFIETKFDGERMQLHKDKNSYRYFSRGGNDYTHVYGGDESSGNLTRFLSSAFKSNVTSCILDGEMVGYNPDTKTISSKGENFDVKTLGDGGGRGYQPMLCVFDVLLFNGQVLSNKPLRERRKILTDIFNHVEGRITMSEYVEKKTGMECGEALNEAIDRREEGIMIKDPESLYKPNARKGGWYKLKPEYVMGLMDELDVVVVGGFFGVGSRSHMMSHFLCAVAVPAVPGVNDGKPSKFYSFCRVGSGYSHTELYEFNRKLAEHWVAFDKRNPPQWLELAPGFKQRPDAYIPPDKSAILQIKAAEITESDQYKTGCTLRFPRVEKIRDDKHWYDCMTTSELEELRQKSAGKLTNQYVFDGEEEQPKRKQARTNFVKPTVASRFRGIDTESVQKVSEVFQSKEFCVVTGSDELSKADAERKLVELGASIVQNPSEETFCLLAGKVNVRVNNLVKKDCYDIVKIEWLKRCYESKQLLDWNPSEMIHSSPNTIAKFSKDYDSYGDSYYEDTSSEKLKEIFEKMSDQIEEDELNRMTQYNIAEIEDEFFPEPSSASIFRLCRVYLDRCACIEDESTRIERSSLDLVEVEIRLGGGTVQSTISDDVSHVIMDPLDMSRLDLIKYNNHSRRRRYHIVTSQWVYDSLQQEKLLSERSYEP